MATQKARLETKTLDASLETRFWNIFAYHSFSRIVARKHGISVPAIDLDSLSNEEIETRLQVMRDLAHLPPG